MCVCVCVSKQVDFELVRFSDGREMRECYSSVLGQILIMWFVHNRELLVKIDLNQLNDNFYMIRTLL